MSGDVHYPGWCCRQIAAQLSQALFTMADLHAQVSDLREENRQLKIKIENIAVMKSDEGTPFTKNLEKSLVENPVSNMLLQHNPIQVRAEQTKELNHPHLLALHEIKQQQVFIEDSLRRPCHNDSTSLNSENKQERIVLNVPSAHIPENLQVKLPQASTSQLTSDFKCEKCDFSFPSTDQLSSHQAIHIGRSFHVCKVCNAMFLLKADLHRHFTTHPNIKQHICQLCGKAYTSKNNYKLHIKTHTGVGLYPCEVCGKAFHSENHLNVHRRIHTGERPFDCQYCDKSFTQKSGLINHTRLHTGEKPFMCPSCPKAFTQKSNLNFHLSKHHPVVENVSS